MIYSERIKKAMELILEVHKGQVDKGGYPYVYHPIHVAERMHSESECLVALLHDVLEDCEGYTLEGLTKTLELTDYEAEALRLITHDKSVDYMTYVEGLAKDPLALKVKFEDLRHNLDFTRMKEKHEKYDVLKKAYLYLLGQRDSDARARGQTAKDQTYPDLFVPLSEEQIKNMTCAEVVDRAYCLAKARGFSERSIQFIVNSLRRSDSRDEDIMSVEALLRTPDMEESVFRLLVLTN